MKDDGTWDSDRLLAKDCWCDTFSSTQHHCCLLLIPWLSLSLSLSLSVVLPHTPSRRLSSSTGLEFAGETKREKPSQSTEYSEENEGSSFSQQKATRNEPFRSATNVLCFLVSAACPEFHCQSLRRKIIKNVIMVMQLKALKLLDSARLTRFCPPTAITIVSARFVSLFYYFIFRVHSCLATSQKLKQKNKTARKRKE